MINSPAAVVNQVNKNGSLKAMFNSYAMMNILNVKTNVFANKRIHLFLITRDSRIMINKDKIE